MKCDEYAQEYASFSSSDLYVSDVPTTLDTVTQFFRTKANYTVTPYWGSYGTPWALECANIQSLLLGSYVIPAIPTAIGYLGCIKARFVTLTNKPDMSFWIAGIPTYASSAWTSRCAIGFDLSTGKLTICFSGATGHADVYTLKDTANTTIYQSSALSSYSYSTRATYDITIFMTTYSGKTAIMPVIQINERLAETISWFYDNTNDVFADLKSMCLFGLNNNYAGLAYFVTESLILQRG